MATITSRVNASNEDANEYPAGATTYLDWNAGYFGAVGVGLNLGLRFSQNISGLSGSTINAGTFLTFRARSTDSGTFQGTWWAEDAAGPPVFATASGNISGRTKTAASASGNSGDFGAWVSGQDPTFPTDTVNDTAIANIIQELATSYTPTAIVLFWLFNSGSRARSFTPYDGLAATAPLLTIDYTAGAGDTIATPDPVVVPIAHPAPTIAAGPVTLTPDPVVVPTDVQIATPIAGAVTATPDPVAAPIVHPVPTAVVGGVIATPNPVPIPIVHPPPLAISEGLDTVLTPDPVVVTISHPVPTVVIGGATATPDPVVAPIVIPSPTLSITVLPDPVVVPTGILVPSVTIGAVVVTPDPVEIPIRIPLPSILGGGEQFASWGVWDQITQSWLGLEQFGDPDDFAPGSVFRLIVGMFTSSASVPVKAYLYNVTDGLKVVGSDITGTATENELLRSGTFYLPTGVAPNVGGLRKYRLEFGGDTGGEFLFHGGKVVAESG
ncbi:MAG: hypothetical protein ACYSUI_19865 [Planctomycetota bacterium]